MTTREIAEAFATLCREGRHQEASDRFWSDEVVSLEAMDGPFAELVGRAAVQSKSDWWYANHEVHGGTVEGPFVHGNQFALRFSMDITVKESGQRMQMTEIGLYTVAGDKVVEERFLY